MVTKDFDVAVVGAGPAGISCLIELSQQGLNTVLLEKNSEPGGAWHSNSFPGSRCDTYGPAYSFQHLNTLARNWRWSMRYSSAQEIKEYLSYCILSFSLSDRIKTGCEVLAAKFLPGKNLWKLSLCPQNSVHCRFLILATGPLSRPFFPDYPGLNPASPGLLHSSQWESKKPDLRGKTVSVMGTGTSAVQIIAQAAKECKKLRVFQRSAVYCLPAGQKPLCDSEQQQLRLHPEKLQKLPLQGALGPDPGLTPRSLPGEGFDAADRETREHLDRFLDKGGFHLFGAFKDLRPALLRNPGINKQISRYICSRIRSVVTDPVTAEKLCPDYPVLSKRPALSDEYYEAFNYKHVQLIHLKHEPVSHFSGNTIVTDTGSYPADITVLATGFHGMKGSFLHINPEGLSGNLKDHWHRKPYTYMGILCHGFPNMFLVNGPLSPGPFSNLMTLSGLQARWINGIIRKAGKNRIVHADRQQELNWAAESEELTKGTIFRSSSSWYTGAGRPDSCGDFLLYINEPSYRNHLAKPYAPELFVSPEQELRDEFSI